MRERGVWCPRIWGKEQVRGGGEGVSRMDRNVKQGEWLMAGGWRTRVAGQDHYRRDHTTEPVLSPGNTLKITDKRPAGTLPHAADRYDLHQE